MDTINSWLDTTEVRRLAERLMNQSHTPLSPTLETAFDKTFVGFEASSPETTQAPVVSKDPIALEPLIGSGTIQHSQLASGSLLDQVKSFRDWVSDRFSAKEIFIIDQSGDVIFDESANQKFHFVARSMADASHNTGSSVGNVRLKISANEILEVVPVETIHGLIVFGAIFPEPLHSESVHQIMRSLFQLPQRKG
ncbi:MAG: hypothetical protein HC845_07040 [Akkermansiaceae bacterium]|nr:hypothetical protein [Akkermansiaceae bacterium]